ncbi:MAG TPA: TonB C-terminal domain-containing protein [Kofleriaceae bacterium]|nr:TonB C-terminal domain-containing protein [Kofleriaceae bacterium]
MTATDQEMQIYSGVGTLFLTSVMIALAIKGPDLSIFGRGKHGERAIAEDMEVIDAALAERIKKPEAQPQKKFKPPDPKQPTLTATRDDQAKPIDKPQDKPTTDPVDPLAQFKRNNNDDEPVGAQTEPTVGAFDGDEFGFGDETRGDPYLGRLKADLLRGWEYPEILSDVGTPIGCIHLEPDGKIEQWELREKSGNAELDDSVERALKGLQKLRNDEPLEVPAHLVPKTRKWICYRMKVKE